MTASTASAGGRRRPEQVRAFFDRVGQLDREGPVPLYYQLQELLKEDIDAGHWQAGQILPSESDLEAGLGVSRTVIRKALDVLQSDGQVIRQKGRGTVVAQPKLRYGAVATAQEWLHEDMAERAQLAEIIDVRLVNAGGNMGKLLQVPAASQLFEVTVVTSVGEPVSLTQAYVRCDASPELAAATAANTGLPLEIGGPELLHQLAASYGLRVHRSELSVEATTANEFECKTLRISARAPMFLVSTLVSDIDDTPLAFLRSVIRTDQFRFAATVVHPLQATADTGTRAR
ncbi:MAG: transcriptional regulator, GntR family [Marmoricola sp.]|nr:transcriptional regulator, GntR family [Marmoricola sp.]